MRIGILGYGRFGRALGSLLLEAGHAYRALDPAAEIPGEHQAASLQDLVEGQEALVLAVPVPALGRALLDLRPNLTSDHLVFDVGSVKVGPCALMEEHLGGGHSPCRDASALRARQPRAGGTAPAGRALRLASTSRRCGSGRAVVPQPGLRGVAPESRGS